MKNENIKYTTDGKKVVVIGNLNSQEKIVQEVFVVGEAEIPSGENFVVKSLHDAPAISWQQKSLNDLKEHYERERKEYEVGIDKYRKLYQSETSLFQEKISYIKQSLNKITHESFDMVVKFISGEVKYIVKDGNYPEIIDFKDFRCDYDKKKLKLLTLFGSNEGDLTWAIGQYSDGSGSSGTFYPFSSYDEAVGFTYNILIEYSSKGPLQDYHIKIAKQHNITLPEECITAYKEAKTKQIQSSIDSLNKQLQVQIDNKEQIDLV